MENQKKYEITISNNFFEHIELYKKAGQKTLLNKIATFTEELKDNPTTGTGKTERLKHIPERVIYSKRINQQHRFIYEIFEEKKEVHILAAYGHYNEI